MKKKLFFRLVSLIAIIFMLAVWIPETQAATLTNARDYLTRQAENLTSGETHEIQFTPATAVNGGPSNKVILVFPDGDDGTWCYANGTDLVVSVASLKDSATALPGTSKTAKCTKGTAPSSYDTITVEGVDNLSAGTTYAVKVSDGSTGKLGTPANTSTGLITIKTNNGSSDIDTRTVATDILTPSEQISVSGQVDPTLSFSITDRAIGFGSITSSAIRYATSDENGNASEPSSGNPSQLSVSTNAASGAVIEIKDTNANSASGLYNSASSTTLTSSASTSISSNQQKFGVYGKNASSLTIAEAFDHDSNSDLAISTSYQTFASSTAPVDTATVDISAIAAVTGTTPAGTYADTLTVVATGKF